MISLRCILYSCVQVACAVVSGFIQYSFTAATAWLYMETLFLHYAVTVGRLKGRALICYMPIAWLCPAPGIGALLAVNVNGFGGDWRCWASYEQNAIWAFLSSIFLLFLVNSAFSLFQTVRSNINLLI